MKKYSLGFVFNSSLDKVLLIHKLKPEWQVGKINGLGGKIQANEDSLTCIVREIKEEASLGTEKEEWVYIGSMGSKEWISDVFGYVYKNAMSDAKSIEQEQVEWFDIASLPQRIISNLNWLIPIALDKIKNKEFNSFSIEYK